VWTGTVKLQLYKETVRTLENSMGREDKKRLSQETVKARGEEMVIQRNCEDMDNNAMAISRNCDQRENYAMAGRINH
jgi:hypothetical protein